MNDERQHAPIADPAFFTPVVYPPVKCPDCGTWWRTATHLCVYPSLNGQEKTR